jgi:NAD(P)H-dependent FMN reductase
MSKLQIIVGSTRPERACDPLVDWFGRRAVDHGAFDVEVLDLRDWPLPMFQEGRGTLPDYSAPIVKAWNEKIAEADAYVMVTPEYNHSFSGVLKNAIDSVFVSFAFRNKPVTAISYSGGPYGGARAIEQLALVMIEMEAAPLRTVMALPHLHQAFDESGEPTSEVTEKAAQLLLDDLAWWSDTLAAGRPTQLPPARWR